MFSVLSETGISLNCIADPQLTIEGRLLSLEGRHAEAALDGEIALPCGTLVRFQTSETLYLGAVESAAKEAGLIRVRVLIEHSVDLEKAAAVRRLWNADGGTGFSL
jgi:hypothetical protein